MTEKERIDKLVKKQGKPVTFGVYLSAYSISKGWTYKDLESYQKIYGDTTITVDDFLPSEENPLP